MIYLKIQEFWVLSLPWLMQSIIYLFIFLISYPHEVPDQISVSVVKLQLY